MFFLFCILGAFLIGILDLFFWCVFWRAFMLYSGRAYVKFRTCFFILYFALFFYFAQKSLKKEDIPGTGQRAREHLYFGRTPGTNSLAFVPGARNFQHFFFLIWTAKTIKCTKLKR